MSAGKRRASPGADDAKNVLQPEISDEALGKLKKISDDIARIELGIERVSTQKFLPVYQRRREILKTIPNFWPTALLHHEGFAMLCQHPEDQKALLHLTDVWVERDPKDHRAFTLEFYFSENPFFSDSVLKKEYKYTPPSTSAAEDTPDENGVTAAMVDFTWERDVEPQVTKISWKSDAKNLVKLHPRIDSADADDDEDAAEPGSFFNFFETGPDDFELGISIATEIFPEALNYYEGNMDMDSDMDSEEEEDEDDDDAAEIDLEKPRAKKQKKA